MLYFIECTDQQRALAESFLNEWHNSAEYITAHTSGSTGKPKEIKLLKADMLTSARSTNTRFGIDSSSVLFSPLSASYIAGKMMIVRALAAGCKVVFTTPSNRFWDVASVREFIMDTHPSLLPIVPSQAAELINKPGDYDQLLSAIGNIIVGGAPMQPDHEQRLLATSGNFFATYGMTETCSHVALRQFGSDRFEAMPGVEFEVDGRSCLSINAPEFSFKQLQTNDIVDLHSPTSFSWRGRFDNVINSGGIKIFPEEMERLLQPAFRYPFYFKGIQHYKWGEAVAMVTSAPAELSDEEILRVCRLHLPHYAVPSEIIRVTTLPTGSNGKLKRL